MYPTLSLIRSAKHCVQGYNLAVNSLLKTLMNDEFKYQNWLCTLFTLLLTAQFAQCYNNTLMGVAMTPPLIHRM